MLKALIFDMGGVIRDSRDAMWLAVKQGFEAAGLQFPFTVAEIWHLRGLERWNRSKEWISALLAFSKTGNIGELFEATDPDSFVDRVVGAFSPNLPQVERIWKVYQHWFVEEVEAARLIRPCAGAIEGLHQLKGRYHLAIFSNMVRSTIERDLKEFGLTGFFDVIVGGDEVPAASKKPDPGGILKVCELLKIKSAEAAYVGDAVSDIAAARAAGCTAIAVLTGMGLETWLRATRPDYVFRDLEELAKVLRQSTQSVNQAHRQNTARHLSNGCFQ